MHLPVSRSGTVPLIANVNVNALRCYRTVSGRLCTNAWSFHLLCQADRLMSKGIERLGVGSTITAEHSISVNCPVALVKA